MDRARLQDLLDRRGSDLAKWPEADRIAAERLIASDSKAAKDFEAARYLDFLIGRSLSAAEAGPQDIASRILAGLPQKLPPQAAAVRKEWILRPFLPARDALWPRVAVLTFAAALGVAAGLFWAEKSLLQDNQPAVAASGASLDVTSVLFETDTASGTF